MRCRCRSRARASLRNRHLGRSIMGSENEAEQSHGRPHGRPYRQCDGRSKRTYELTSSIVPRGTSSHRSVELDFLLSGLILSGFHAAAVACSRVHRNSVPSTHMRCMTTASRRARATIAFFIPRRLAICMAQALSHDHFSNRPFGVKHFQTIHQCGVDVARGLVLLFGIGTWAVPSWDPRTRRNNLMDDLTVSVTADPSGHTNSPRPSSREGHLPTARWSSIFSYRV